MPRLDSCNCMPTARAHSSPSQHAYTEQRLTFPAMAPDLPHVRHTLASLLTCMQGVSASSMPPCACDRACACVRRQWARTRSARPKGGHGRAFAPLSMQRCVRALPAAGWVGATCPPLCLPMRLCLYPSQDASQDPSQDPSQDRCGYACTPPRTRPCTCPAVMGASMDRWMDRWMVVDCPRRDGCLHGPTLREAGHGHARTATAHNV